MDTRTGVVLEDIEITPETDDQHLHRQFEDKKQRDTQTELFYCMKIAATPESSISRIGGWCTHHTPKKGTYEKFTPQSCQGVLKRLPNGAVWTGRRKMVGKEINTGKSIRKIDRWDENDTDQYTEQWTGVTMFEYAFPSITFEPLDGGGVTDPASGEELKLREEMKRCLYSPFVARRIFEPLSKMEMGLQRLQHI